MQQAPDEGETSFPIFSGNPLNIKIAATATVNVNQESQRHAPGVGRGKVMVIEDDDCCKASQRVEVRCYMNLL